MYLDPEQDKYKSLCGHDVIKLQSIYYENKILPSTRKVKNYQTKVTLFPAKMVVKKTKE